MQRTPKPFGPVLAICGPVSSWPMPTSLWPGLGLPPPPHPGPSPPTPPPPAPHPDSAHPITEQGSLMSARRLPADSPAFSSPTHIPSCNVFRAHRALWHLQALVPHLPPSLEDSAQTKRTPRTPALSATPSPPSTQSQSAPENSAGRGGLPLPHPRSGVLMGCQQGQNAREGAGVRGGHTDHRA